MAVRPITVKGLDKALKKLDQEVSRVSTSALKGLIKAGLIIQRSAQKLVPVDTGNLKSSAFTVWSTGQISAPTFRGKEAGERQSEHEVAIVKRKRSLVGKRLRLKSLGINIASPQVEVGFTASYAALVHENTQADKDRKKGESKFLEKAVKNNIPLILQAVRGELK